MNSNNLGSRAFTLIELLLVITLLGILAAITMPSVVKAKQWAKAWSIGIYANHNAKLNAFLSDTTSDRDLLYWSTNQPKPWVFVKTP